MPVYLIVVWPVVLQSFDEAPGVFQWSDFVDAGSGYRHRLKPSQELFISHGKVMESIPHGVKEIAVF